MSINLRFWMLSRCLRASKFIQQRSGSNCQYQYVVAVQQIHSQRMPWTILQSRDYVKALVPDADSTSLDKILKKIEKKLEYNRRIARDDIDIMLEKFDKCRNVSAQHALSVIKCFGSTLMEEVPVERMRLMNVVWQRLQEIECHMNILHYNQLLRVFVENEHSFTPENFLLSIEEANLEPDSNTYNTLIVHFCRRGDIDGAVNMLQRMIDKGFTVDSSIMNTLILGYGQAGDWHAARNHVQTMIESGVTISRQTIVCLLCAYATSGQIDQLHDELIRHTTEGIVFDQSDYLNIIYELSANGHASAALDIVSLVSLNSGREQEVINTIMRLIQKKNFDVAYQLLLLIAKHTHHDFARFSESFIHQLIKSGCSLDACMEYTDQLHALSPIQHAHYLNLVMAYSRKASIEEQVNLLRVLKSKNVPLNLSYFRPLLNNGMAKDHNAVLRLMKREFDVQPTAHFIREYVLPSVNMTEPWNVMYSLWKVGVRRTTATSSVVIECLRRHQLSDAAQITTMHPVFLHPEKFQHSMVAALVATDEFDAFTELMRNVYRKYQMEAASNDDRIVINRDDMAGQMVCDVINAYDADVRAKNAKKILSGFAREHIAISGRYAERIHRDFAGDAELAMMLGQLSNSKLAYGDDQQRRSGCKALSPSASSTTPIKTDLLHRSSNAKKPVKSKSINALGAVIQSKNVARMLQCFNALQPHDFVHMSTLVRLLETLIKEKACTAAKDILIHLLRKGLLVPRLTRIIHYFAAAGDVASLEQIEPHVNHQIDFLSNLVLAHCKAGREEDLIANMTQRLQRCATEADLQVLRACFPTKSFYTLLEQRPELQPKFQALAEQYVSRKAFGPMTVLWYQHLVSGNVEVSRQIYTDYLQSLPTAPNFKTVLTAATDSVDPRPVFILIDLVKATPAHRLGIVTPYKCLLGILCKTKRFDEAVGVLEDARNYISVGDCLQRHIVSIRKGLEAEGKTLPRQLCNTSS